MAVRAQKPVLQFRGVTRAQMKHALYGVTSVLHRNTIARVPFLTTEEVSAFTATEGFLTTLLAQKVFV